MNVVMAAWLLWVAIAIVVTVAVSWGIAFVMPGHQVEATILGFAAGIGFTALTPTILRRASRIVR